MIQSDGRFPTHDFGIVVEHGDWFEFQIDATAGACCRLVSVVQTERGPRRTELVEICSLTWQKINNRVVRELAQDMGENEIVGKKLPSFKIGTNRLSPLVGRELALLLWALNEEGAGEQLEAILHGWRELAREERWWLYAKAAAPGQNTGTGWRRALFHALSETAESRLARPLAEKKSPPKSHRLLSPVTRDLDFPPRPLTPTAKAPNPAPVKRRRKTTGMAMETATNPN
jgi:hypothetical protein